QATLVPYLAAGLCVERSPVQDQLRVRAGRNGFDHLAVDQQPYYTRCGREVAIADEFRAPAGREFLICRRQRALLRAFPTRARPFALLVHLPFEALAVDRQTTLARHFFLLVQCQAVGVV